VPRTDARSIRVRANIIIVQKVDGTGNFQDIPEHRAFLDEWFYSCNARLGYLWGTSNCAPGFPDAKIELVPNWIFYKDDATEFYWNNDNQPGTTKCPGPNWWLNGLDALITADPGIPRGINVYITSSGTIYNQMVVLGTIDNPEQAGMTYVWCSQHPSVTNLNASSRINVPNLFLKYWWFQNHPDVVGAPFSVSRQWIVGNEGVFLAHEFAHSFIGCYVHNSTCSNHLLAPSGGLYNFLRPDDVGCIHRNLAISNLRQFVECGETYNTPNSTLSDREVTTNETWDLDMRLYTNVTVKTGATLTVTCKLLMPLDGLIRVERGAKLIVDGGTIARANTCSSSEYWKAIAVQGNGSKIQPNPNSILVADDAGVVILKNKGMIEGARVGVSTHRELWIHEPWMYGGLVDVEEFTFQDCRKGVEFTPYYFPNQSRFKKASFIRTPTGTSYAGVTIWDTDGITFEECAFTNMTQTGIRTADAVFNVIKKNQFTGSEFGILSSASAPLSGQIQVGILGLQGTDRNLFFNNTVGIRATANSRVEVFSNQFENSNFDIALNGATQSAITDNGFRGSAAGNQFDNTGINSNQNLCNVYLGNTVGTNIVGANTGFLFRNENFSTLFHDLFIEGPAAAPGEIPIFQGTFGAARWNYFSANKPQNIKTSTVSPNNNTVSFFYFHPDPAIDPRLKPKCALNDACTPQSNFNNLLTFGPSHSNCVFPNPSGEEPCKTKPCLDVIIAETGVTVQAIGNNPEDDALQATLQGLVTQQEYITDELIRGYLTTNNWTAVESLLDENPTPGNRRRKVGAKIAQKQYAAAETLLQSFPQNTLDDTYFVQVQEINLARLTTPAFALNGSQEALLLNVAAAPSPEAGYAQGLLSILKDMTFMPVLPDIGNEAFSVPQSGTAQASTPATVLEVAPNPVSDVLQVTITRNTIELSMAQTIELRGLATGRLVYSADITDQIRWSIPVHHLPAGVYVVRLTDEQSGITQQHRVIVQH